MDDELFKISKAHLESIGFRHDYGYNFKRGYVALQWEEDQKTWIGWTNDGSIVWFAEHLPSW